jgi:hypothetical protein
MSATRTRRPPRAVLARWAQELKAEGKVQREVADALGVSRSYAAELMGADPLGEKARDRKKRYQGVCVDCGGATTGTMGRAKAPERCADCRAEFDHARRFWTAERVVAEFQRFARVMGRGPTVIDCPGQAHTPTISRKITAARLAETDRAAALGLLVPHPDIVRREFGTWHAALRAAGLPRNPKGRRPS